MSAPGETEEPAHPAYPDHWEADIVLRDGGTAHLRPITEADANRLVAFYGKVSDESKYYRFFAPYPRLSARDVHRFTHHDFVDRVGLAATVGDEILATVRYDRIDDRGRPTSLPADRAEVAFLVQDAHQGRGLASVLLEHIAACARERGIRRFAAEVLPVNTKMTKVFTDAGYSQHRSFEDGSIHLSLDLAPTAASLGVTRAREQRAEARSVQRLLAPAGVVVIGASSQPVGAGRTALAGLFAGGFAGQVHVVNHALPAHRNEVGGAPAYRSVREVPGPVDLAVLAVPAAAVRQVVAECGEHGVRSLLVLASGHTPDDQRALVQQARGYGMRLVGPEAFGVINTDPAVCLNASLAPRLPRRGRIGLFTQSAAIGIAALDELEQTGTGLSSFVSAGNRADVSGNDLLQYWYEDERTDVVLMYLESLGNPRKFTRLVRRSAAEGRPVAVVRRQADAVLPHGHTVPRGRTPAATVSALLRQAGVIEAGTVTELLDIGLLLTHQPLPAGDRIGVLGNAESLGLAVQDACRTHRLTSGPVQNLAADAGPQEYGRALAAALTDPETDAVVVTAIPTLGGTLPLATDADEPEGSRGGAGPALGEALHRAVEEAGVGKPVLVAHLAIDGLATALTEHAIPAYPSTERAVRALARAVHYAEWYREAVTPGAVPEFDDIDPPAAANVLEYAVERVKPAHPPIPVSAAVDGQTEPVATALSTRDTRDLLAAYGIPVLPARAAPNEEAAVTAAQELGYPIALKTTAPQWRHRADLGGIRLDLGSAAGLRRAYAELTAELGPPEELHPVVQPMAPRGVDTVVRATVDPLIGAVLSFGLAGPPSELLGDVAHRLLPVTGRAAHEVVRAIRAAPMLFGWRGARPVDTKGLEELLTRVGRLVDGHPEITGVELEPVVVAQQGVHVLTASVAVAPPPPRTGPEPRSLPAY